MLDAKLVVVGGDAKQKEVRLKTLPTVIGRGRDVTLTLPHPLVSRQHCEIFEQQGHLYVKDLQSLNGTYVNNTKIEDEQILEPNQLLTLGNVTFRAVYQPAGANTAASSDPKDETFRVTGRLTTLDCKPVTDQAKSDTDGAGLPEEDTDHDYAADQLETIRKDPPAKGPKKPVGPKKTVYGKPTPVEHKSADTDEVSNVFIVDEETQAAGKSVSLSAIDGLPAEPSQASFGSIEVDKDQRPAATVEETVRIDMGDEESNQDDPSESALGSFFRKLPK